MDWICPIQKHKYSATMNSRTADGNGCLTCYHEAMRLVDKIEVKQLIETSYNKNKIKSKTIAVGDKTEEYIVDVLLKENKYKSVSKIGNIGGDSDICVTHFDGLINQIQVKTLTKSKENVYYCNLSKYPDNMLLVLTNKEEKRFAVMFARDTDNVQCLKLTFNTRFTKHFNRLFTDEKSFISYMVSQIPFSTQINKMCKTIEEEAKSLERLEEYCKDRGIDYRRNTTNDNPIDLFMNDLRVQAKYVSHETIESQNYRVASRKHAGRINGKDIKRPYEEDDFDIFIINIGGTKEEPNKYMNDFCIIPSHILEEKGILKTKTQEGRNQFAICSPDSQKDHWSKQYWNNLDCIF